MIGGIGAFLAIVLFVTAHEAGHFLAAKATGMKATEFFFGFGPRLWSFKRGETEYGFKALPLGGYVKIVGMSALEEVADADEERTYRNQAFWKKSIVVLAGVGANFLIAYLMFFGIAVAEGVDEPITTVGTVLDEYEGVKTAAAEAGLLTGDEILAVDGVATDEWVVLAAELASHPDDTITLKINRDGVVSDVVVALGSRVDPVTGETVGFLGLSPERERVPIGIGEGLGIAARQVYGGFLFTFESFGRLLQVDNLTQLAGGLIGRDVSDDIRPVSVIGIVQIGSQAETLGVTNLLFMLALVNVILGTLNVLPLYPLDGGHFAVALYEKLRGRRADVTKLIPVAAAVILLIAFIGIVAIVLDIVNPIRL